MTSTGWRWDPVRFRAELEALGYDVDAAEAVLHGGGSLAARRDLGSRSHLVALDAGGRFRATITVALDEVSGEETVAGVALRVVAETWRSVTVSGTLTEADHLPSLLVALDRLATGRPDDHRSGRPSAEHG